MENNSTKLYMSVNNNGDFTIANERVTINYLQQEAELCSGNQYSDDEVTAAVGMMLMNYQVVDESQITPKNKSIERDVVIANDATVAAQPSWNTPKSNSVRSAILASCRNILKEILAQNGV